MEAHSRPRRGQPAGLAALALAFALALGACAGGFANRTAPAGQWRAYRARFADAAPSRGAPDAPVVVELFSDFECPFCARVRATVDALLARYPREVQLVWRDYPLPVHPAAMQAAEAAREAFAQGGSDAFWRYHDLLFAHQDALGRDDLVHYAQLLELDVDRFRAALERHAHHDAIAADMAAADASGVEMATPSFFINGRYVAGALPVHELQPYIDAALAQTH
jgi:protein-disulfide isomerase